MFSYVVRYVLSYVLFCYTTSNASKSTVSTLKVCADTPDHTV